LKLTRIKLQFLGDFMTESVETLEHLANQEKPPLSRQQLEDIRDQYLEKDKDKDELRSRLSGMAQAFQGRGDLKEWSNSVLDEIDASFVRHYMAQDKATDCLFLPNSADNLKAHQGYCIDVDRILAKSRGNVPQYAREYFTYSSIWEVHGYAFPMPLGTKTVIDAMAGILQEMRSGVIEVSCRFDIFVCYGYVCGNACTVA
jgi:hypothetical protein